MAEMKIFNNWLYEIGPYNHARYILGIKGNHPIICVGINPSTAEPCHLDNTLKSVSRLSKSNGFDSWIMLNLYPQRSTNPKDVHDLINLSWHVKNLEAIENVFKSQAHVNIWAAWGIHINSKPFFYQCLYEIYQLSQNYPCVWLSIGPPTKEGHPRHPLYLKSTIQAKPFGIREYLSHHISQ